MSAIANGAAFTSGRGDILQDEWAEGYRHGFDAGRQQAVREDEERLMALFDQDLDSSKVASIWVAQRLYDEVGVQCRRFVLRNLAFSPEHSVFESLLFVPIKDYLEPTFSLAYSIAREVRDEFSKRGFEVRFSFAPVQAEEEPDTLSLLADGFAFSFVRLKGYGEEENA